MLYQRYFLHTNQSHMTHLLLLLLGLSAVLGAGHLACSLSLDTPALLTTTTLLACVIVYAGQ